MDKKEYFTIGEISKITGASIFSLRYYERIKILKPILTDPSSGYRYYSFEQIFHIQIIMICVELDIPLKKIIQFADDNCTIDYLSLLSYGKEIANGKLQNLQRTMKYIDSFEQKSILAQKYNEEQIYSRYIPQKLFYIIPYNKTFDNSSLHEIIKTFMGFEYYNGDYKGELVEYGIMCEYLPSKVQRYAFVELEKPNIKVVTKTIPSGIYFCIQNNYINIERAYDIFSNHINSTGSFLAIETIFFSNKYKVSSPVTELRIIPL